MPVHRLLMRLIPAHSTPRPAQIPATGPTVARHLRATAPPSPPAPPAPRAPAGASTSATLPARPPRIDPHTGAPRRARGPTVVPVTRSWSMLAIASNAAKKCGSCPKSRI